MQNINIDICGNFWQKIGFLTPWVPIFRVPLNCYAVDHEDMASRFNLNAILCFFLCVI